MEAAARADSFMHRHTDPEIDTDGHDAYPQVLPSSAH